MGIGVIGLILNTYSILFFVRQRTQRTFHRLLVLLAMTDSIHIISSLISFSLPTLSSEFFLRGHKYTLPYSLPLAQTTMVMSVYLTISLTLERYISIVYPLLSITSRPTRTSVYLSVPSIIFSILFTLPNYFMLHTEERRELPHLSSKFQLPKENQELEFRWANFRSNEAYITVYVLWLHLIFINILPFCVLLWLNRIIYKKLSEVNVPIRRTGENILRKREVRMARVSILIVIIFLLCHTLKFVPSVCEIISGNPEYIPHVVELAHLLIIVNCSVNFLIYACSSGNSIFDIFTLRRQRNTSSPLMRSNIALQVIPRPPSDLAFRAAGDPLG
ncbi:FMRFamide receptor [Eurytemora carolleeae]|uniref:FMRFamide receptor n=1 Tax=Eurytemora carolleeae TaxID=1294199 RepID=UPI000C789EF5|nr:FMRFamide receptor [Eurytemora carolleeae]|eukprot:XP_023339076.1 FMRFamide receptor-like [Eurytemora affinis]